MAEAILTGEKAKFTITRTFDAPRDLVWKAWTRPEYFNQWWGPKTFTAPVVRTDFRVGGRYLWCMRSLEGKDFWSTGVFREIVEPAKIAYTDAFSDADGNVVPASAYGMSEDWPQELPVTVTFEEHEGGTLMTLQEDGVPEGEMLDMARAGWNESLDKLARVLEKGEVDMTKTNLTAEPGKQEIVITRVFDATRDLVFGTYMDPELIPRWWGPKDLTTTIEKMDARPGGIWRFVQRDAEGNEYGFHGVFHDIAPPERLIFTFEYEGIPGHVLLETITLEDVNGRTKMTDRAVFPTVEDRDGMLQSGEEGMTETTDRFAELVEEKKRT
ncbi:MULTISPECIES: SRPBCC domain-containing protein [unclassified Methanoculleus]|jgi:uncharacterized protein YndB with AHSA1/START domain|uniref:SRPBCC domain-containing protein n=1 Tax=Methanoculleus palmolei TaxID=72612 RepID=A0ABD8AAJ6_9EURY|nr:SRPBCC domain-containing protein [Methanoculleus sp.]WOX56562.1 SRPBCC domain-containing protein [Methanoculleus palmolei]